MLQIPGLHELTILGGILTVVLALLKIVLGPLVSYLLPEVAERVVTRKNNWKFTDLELRQELRILQSEIGQLHQGRKFGESLGKIYEYDPISGRNVRTVFDDFDSQEKHLEETFRIFKQEYDRRTRDVLSDLQKRNVSGPNVQKIADEIFEVQRQEEARHRTEKAARTLPVSRWLYSITVGGEKYPNRKGKEPFWRSIKIIGKKQRIRHGIHRHPFVQRAVGFLFEDPSERFTGIDSYSLAKLGEGLGGAVAEHELWQKENRPKRYAIEHPAK